MSSDREERLEELLARFLRPLRGIPFEVMIRALCESTVHRFDRDVGSNRAALASITEAMRATCRAVQESPIQRPRPNEVGNDMEPFVIEALQAQGMAADAAKTKSGRGKTTGYPDVKIKTDDLPIYLEVKTYAAANYKTTQRSFYLSPAEDHKVGEDGHHLLVGFEIERKGDLFTPVAFEVVDLFGLDCDMKAEVNSDNLRLYQDHRILAKERV